MDSLYFTDQVHFLGTPVMHVITVDQVVVPEYFNQVTRGHNTSVLHAKYVSYQISLNGKAVDSAFILNNGVIQDDIGTEADGRWVQTALVSSADPLSKGGTVTRYWSQVEKATDLAWVGYGVFRYDNGHIVCVSNVGGWFSNTGLPDYPSLADIKAIVPTSNWVRPPRMYSGELSIPELPNPVTAFRFAEPSLAVGKLRLDSISGYPLVLRAMQDCVSSCLDEVARLNENNVANLIEVVGFVFSILHGKFDVPRSWKRALSPQGLSNLWLWWRYAYTTGVMDHKQALDYLQRQVQHYARTTKYHAASEVDVNEVSLRISLSFNSRVRNDDIANMLSHRAWSAGIELNPYVIWDLIPFSFVVDWFTDTGDRLQHANDLKHLYADYDLTDICWSFRYQTEVQFGTVECYYRFYGPLPAADGFVYHPRGVSQVTALKRGIDTAALVLGGS